ncbi:hypothetical protein [Kitasatospora viridis]|uniref:Putative ABC transport system permease protein n=1 Tax=Kitasatospora viridis TaxID=281105 RepID=A0A561UKU4_9ACTN|nr:hypothetical protein [Kitasatospora viridis]TWF99983.1 putative ABC transport system permease protein [Kitasatospora viridis]
MIQWWLVRREAGAAWPVVGVLAGLIAVLTAVVLGWPARFDRLTDRALAAEVGQAQSLATLVGAHGETEPALSAWRSDPGTPASQDDDLDRVGRAMEQHAGPWLGERRGQAETGAAAVQGLGMPYGHAPIVRLAYRQQADLPYVQGRAPGAGADGQVEVAVSEATRDGLGLTLGQHVQLASSDGWSARVVLVGVFRTDPADARTWRQLPLAVAPLTVNAEVGKELDGELLTSRDGLAQVRSGDRTPLTLGWDWTVTPGPGDGTVDGLRGRLAQLAQFDPTALCDAAPGVGCELTGQRLTTLTVQDGLTPVLTDFADRRARTVQVQQFALAGLLTVGVATGFAAARLGGHRRRGAFELQRLRGAGRGQLAGRLLLETAPAVPVGLGAGRLLAALLGPPGTTLGAWLPALLAAVLLLCAPAAVLLLAPPAAARRPQARRLVLEGSVLLLTAAALAGVRLRGDSASPDPQLALTPSLLALVLVLALLRLVPPLVRLAARTAARGRGAVPLLGLARATELGAAAVPVLLVLILAMGGGVFGGLVSGTVSAGRQQVADWRTGGAPAAFVGPVDRLPDPAAAGRAAGARGTAAVLAASGDLTAQQDGTVFPRATLVGVDPAALRAVDPGSALATALLGAGLDRAPVGGAPGQEPVLPALGDAALAAAYPDGTFEVAAAGRAGFLVQLVGTLPTGAAGDPALGPVLGDQPRDTALLVFAGPAVPLLPHQSGHDSALLVGGAPDRGTLALLAAGRYGSPGGLGQTVRLRWRDQELTQLRADGLARSTDQAFLGATALGLLLALGTVLLDLLLSAGERGRTLSRLRTLGLGGRGATGLGLLQALPLLLAAVTGGAALGLLLPTALGGALPLRAITGGPADPAVRPDWTLTAGLGAALLLLVLGAVALEAALSRGQRVRAALRLGEEL